MATTYAQYLGDGIQQVFAIPFPYLYQDDVKVRVNGSLVPRTFDNPGQIRVSPAPGNGDLVDVRRETERVERLVDFENGSNFTEAQLDLSFLQVFYIVQESLDIAGGTLTLTVTGDYDAGLRRITGVGAPIDPTDVVTKAYHDSNYIPQMQALVAAAAGSSNAAASSAGEAAQYAFEAAGYAGALNLPSISGQALNFIRVNSGATGYEIRTPTQVRDQLGLGANPLFSGRLRSNEFKVLRSTSAPLNYSAPIYFDTPMNFEEGNPAGDWTALDRAFWNQAGGWHEKQILLASGSLFLFRSNGVAYSPSGWQTTSDKRLKSDIQPITGAMEKVRAITGYTFTKHGVQGRTGGLIAQEVLPILPEAISDFIPLENGGNKIPELFEKHLGLDTAQLKERLISREREKPHGRPQDREDQALLSLDTGPVVGLLVNALKELDARVVVLEAEVERLSSLVGVIRE